LQDSIGEASQTETVVLTGSTKPEKSQISVRGEVRYMAGPEICETSVRRKFVEERDEFSVGCERKKQKEIHEWKEEGNSIFIKLNKQKI